MTTDLIERIATLARQWDDEARTISLDEVVGRTTPTFDGPDEAALVEVRSLPTRRPRTALVVGAVAAAAAIIVGLLVITGRDGRTIDDVGTSPSIAAPPTIVTVATSVVPSTTTTATTVPPTTIDSASELNTIESAVMSSLAEVHSFRATATVSRSTGQSDCASCATTTVYDITLTSDGSLWAVGQGEPAMTWASYDASTGTARNLYTGPDGVTHEQQVDGWTDNFTPLNIVLGFDPVMRFDGIDDATIEEVTVAGRPAWNVTHKGDLSRLSSKPGSQTDTFTIDQQWGLIVAYSSTKTEGDVVTQFETASLSNVVVDAPMPADFPGTFADPAAVEMSGSPSTVAMTSLDDAITQFGPGLVVPADLPVDARISISHTEMGFGGGDDQVSTGTTVSFEWRLGFLVNRVEVSKWPATTGAPVEGYVIVDGHVCFSTDGATCESADTLDEAKRTMAIDAASIGLQVGVVTISVIANTPADAVHIAQGLVAAS